MLFRSVITIIQLKEDTLLANHSPSPIPSPSEWSPALCILQGILGLRLRLEDIQRFGICQTHRQTETIGWGEGISVCLISGVVAESVKRLVEMYGREIGVAVFAIAVVDVGTDGNIAPLVAKPPVQLQLRTDIVVASVTHRLVLPPVDNEVLFVHQGPSLGTQWVGDIIEWVGIDRRGSGEATAIIGGETHIRAKRECGHVVNRPLKVHVSRPIVITRETLANAI